MKFKFLLILIVYCFNAYSQTGTKIFFKQTQADSIGRKIDSILIIGAGSSVTRIFLDDLSDYIIGSLREDSIATKYHFLGKSFAEGRNEYDTINKEGFNAILLLLPKGESIFDVEGRIYQTRANSSVGRISPKIAKSQSYYQQDFNISLCIPGPDLNAIWTASLAVSCDLGNPKNSKKVGKMLLSYFKTNKYIE